MKVFARMIFLSFEHRGVDKEVKTMVYTCIPAIIIAYDRIVYIYYKQLQQQKPPRVPLRAKATPRRCASFQSASHTPGAKPVLGIWGYDRATSIVPQMHRTFNWALLSRHVASVLSATTYVDTIE